MWHNVATDIVCLNKKKLKCKSKKNRILHFFACFCDNLVRKKHNSMFFSFGLLALTQLPNDYRSLRKSKYHLSFFTALYSFMVAWQPTQNSETKNGGVGVEHRGVSVECSKQTQNSGTKNDRMGVEHRGVCGMFETKLRQMTSLESSSFVHCEYYIFKILDAKIKFFLYTLYKRTEVLPRGPLVRGPKK